MTGQVRDAEDDSEYSNPRLIPLGHPMGMSKCTGPRLTTRCDSVVGHPHVSDDTLTSCLAHVGAVRPTLAHGGIAATSLTVTQTSQCHVVPYNVTFIIGLL